MAAAFGEDDEDEPKRRLIPLQYTDEEQKAAAAAAAQPAAAQEAPGPDGGARAQQAQIAQLKQSLPRSKEAVFAATIKWDAYAEAQPKLGEKVGTGLTHQVVNRPPRCTAIIIIWERWCAAKPVAVKPILTRPSPVKWHLSAST